MKNDEKSRALVPPSYQSATAEKAASRSKLGTSNRQTHEIGPLTRAVKDLGGRVIDRRTALGKALYQWRSDLLRDLGGSEEVSAQKLALADLAVRTKLMRIPSTIGF